VQTSSVARNGVAAWGPVGVALALIAVATLVPTRPSTGTPFWCLACGDYALADVVANVALFVPLGWALARTPVRLPGGLACVLTTTIGVELLQYTIVPGRDAALSDILTNTLGGVAGMALPSLQVTIAESGRRAVWGATLYGVLLLAGLGVGEATQAVPLPRTLRWTEGTGRPDYVPFAGSLKAVAINGTPVGLHQWLNVPPREVVDVKVCLLSGRPNTGLAQVLVAWTPRARGWMWLELQDRDLRVHLASASDHARLRGHSTWLRAVMPATAGESVEVRVVVRRFAYRIAVGTKGGDVVRDQTISPGDGWRLFTPFEREREPWAGLLTAGWMAVLLAPLGYLASARSGAGAVVAGAFAGVGLVALPIVLGGAWLPLSAWCGAASGFVGGSRSQVHRHAEGGVDT